LEISTGHLILVDPDENRSFRHNLSFLCRLLKKSASGVLAALGRTALKVRLVSSLSAALLDGLFEQPAASCEIAWNF